MSCISLSVLTTTINTTQIHSNSDQKDGYQNVMMCQPTQWEVSVEVQEHAWASTLPKWKQK